MELYMSIKLINNVDQVSNNREYCFITMGGIEIKFKTSIDNDDLLIKNLKNKQNCCYHVQKEVGEMFFLKTMSGIVFNPNNDSTSYRSQPWKWTKISKKIYLLYIKFLETRQQRLYSAIGKMI